MSFGSRARLMPQGPLVASRSVIEVVGSSPESSTGEILFATSATDVFWHHNPEKGVVLSSMLICVLHRYKSLLTNAINKVIHEPPKPELGPCHVKHENSKTGQFQILLSPI